MRRRAGRVSERAARLSVAMLALVAWCLPRAMSDVDVHASLNRDTVAVGERAELTIVVTGDVRGIGEPRLPDIEGLAVVSHSSGTNLTFGSGAGVSSTMRHTYELQAYREGTYTIAAIEVQAGGQTVKSQPLTLKVTAGTAAPPATTSPVPAPSTAPGGGEPVFAATEVDNPEPYVGEQVTLSFKLYHSKNLAGVDYSPPSTEGLVTEPLPESPERQVLVEGQVYGLVERQTALLAPTPGEYTIGPAQVSYTLGFFDREHTIGTKPITLKARPLPSAGKPAGFSGAVGQLGASLSMDKTQVTVGEALTVSLAVEGTGNLRQLQAPDLTVSDECKWYRSGEKRVVAPQAEEDRYVLGGSVTFEYLMIPREKGTLRIEPVELHYFDPEQKQYLTARTQGVEVKVLPGAAEATGAEQPTGEDIAYIKVEGGGLRARQPATATHWFWLAQLLPLLGLGFVARQRAVARRLEADPRYRRFVQAAPRAKARLRDALRSAKDDRARCEALDELVTEFVADKLGVAASSLSPEGAAGALREGGIEEPSCAMLAETMRALREGRFAPGGAAVRDMAELVAGVKGQIDGIEARLRRP